MANEAVLMFETSLPIPMVRSDTTVGIEQGAALQLVDEYKVSGARIASALCGGIAAAEAIASDGISTVPVYRSGIFKVKVSGSCTVGDAMTTDTSINYFKAIGQTYSFSGSKVWGIALGTATTDQTVLMELRPMGVVSQ